MQRQVENKHTDIGQYHFYSQIAGKLHCHAEQSVTAGPENAALHSVGNHAGYHGKGENAQCQHQHGRGLLVEVIDGSDGSP